jgi:hypothetical protein
MPVSWRQFVDNAEGLLNDAFTGSINKKKLNVLYLIEMQNTSVPNRGDMAAENI